MSDVIEAKDLRLWYGKPEQQDKRGKPKGVKAVDGIDLAITKGEIFGLLGPNGAGKTTTLSMLVTIKRPTGGWARVAGIDVRDDPDAVRRHVGIVFQEPSLDTLLSARENLMLHGRLYGVPPGELAGRTKEMLDLVGLADRADDLVKKFSGGMKRRLEIARGLFHRPEVLFLDEPTLGLDPATREHIWEYIRKLRDESGTTVVLTTHYMEEADSLCDRIAIIDKGKIVALGTPRELKALVGGDLVILAGVSPEAEARLARLSVVRKSERKGATLTLTVEDAGSHLPEIVQAAGKVDHIEVRTPRLEDVFLHFTGRGLREEGGEDWFEQYQNVAARGQG
ncbi:MAG: type transport system ATP-binding protein [Thermoplasmata archaeon]|jgi:ABC-2 type transport system ATP-binding protein|nr:type transport system ATP-binding protein [Thermoplasmata archaeon]